MASRIPGVLAKISDTAETTSLTELVKVLLIGIKLPAGSLAVNTPKKITSESEALDLVGEGSQLLQMVRASRAQNSRVDLSIIAVDAGAGVAATQTITFGGAATTANPVILRIGDVQIIVPIQIADDGTAVATALDAELAKPEFAGLHVTGGQAAAVETLTAKSAGIHGNEILVKIVETPPGVTAVVAAGVAGTLAPDVDGALQSIGLVRYNYIGIPDVDATNLTDVDAFLADLWTKFKARDGHAVAGKRDTPGNLSTLGLGLDSKHLSIFGNPVMPNNPWEQAAVVCSARATQTNPVFPIVDDDLALVSPDEADRLGVDDLNTIMDGGIATFQHVGDTPRVRRFLTLQKTNDDGAPTEAFLDVETKLTTSAYRQETSATLKGEIGKVLVADASSVQYAVGVSQGVTDTARIRQLLIAQYSLDAGNFESLAWVSKPDEYQASLTVDQTGPNTVAVFSAPIINGTLYHFNHDIEFTLNT